MTHSKWKDRQHLATTPPDVVAAIKGASLLVDRFGGWPTFEDAEVISLAFERGSLLRSLETGDYSTVIYPSITAVFYVFDNLHASDSTHRKETVATIRFEGLDRFELDGFNHQNPIVGLEIISEYSERLKSNLFAVDWGGSGIHHEVSFTCGTVEVVEIGKLSEFYEKG